jgi:hypothetical protein
MADDKNVGMFVPLTSVWEIQQIRELSVNSPEFKDLLVKLYQTVNNIAISLNKKDTGYYSDIEFVCGQVFFPDPALSSSTPQSPTYRQVFRKVINFGTLPNAGVQSILHGIDTTQNVTFTRIYGVATDSTAPKFFYPIPFASPVALNQNIEITVDATHVNIRTGVDRTNFDRCFVVIEWIKS